MSILNEVPNKSLGTTINRCSPDEIVEILQACVGTLSDVHDVDVTDLESAIEMLEFTRDYDVSVSITFDLSVRVNAKDEKEAARIVYDEITETELVNGDCNEFVQDIDMQNIDLNIHDVEEA